MVLLPSRCWVAGAQETGILSHALPTRPARALRASERPSRPALER